MSVQTVSDKNQSSLFLGKNSKPEKRRKRSEIGVRFLGG